MMYPPDMDVNHERMVRQAREERTRKKARRTAREKARNPKKKRKMKIARDSRRVNRR